MDRTYFAAVHYFLHIYFLLFIIHSDCVYYKTVTLCGTGRKRYYSVRFFRSDTRIVIRTLHHLVNKLSEIIIRSKLVIIHIPVHGNVIVSKNLIAVYAVQCVYGKILISLVVVLCLVVFQRTEH